MNGIIFIELGKFAQSKLDSQTWKEVMRLSGVPSRVYAPVADYPDQDAVALLTTLSSHTGEPVPVILEALGEFSVPDFIKMYDFLINPEWKTIDLIANTEATIHEVLRGAWTKNKPPSLKCRRISPREVVVTYNSPRKMCAYAKGIAKGVAKHYGEQISIIEPTCMLKGATECELIIALV